MRRPNPVNGAALVRDSRQVVADAVDPQAIGVEVSWSFGDGSADAVRLDRGDVIEAFREHGFRCDLDAHLDPDDALCRARAVAKNRSWLVVREIERPNKDVSRVLGVYVRQGVDQTSVAQGMAHAEEGDEWQMAARVRFDQQAAAFVCFPPEGQVVFRTDRLGRAGQSEGERLADFANLTMRTAVNGDVSEALVSACQQAGCVNRRPGGGGVYLVLAGERCQAVVDLLRTLQRMTTRDPNPRAWTRRFTAQCQETYAKPLTVGSWAASAEQQVQGSVDRMLADLEDLLATGAVRTTTSVKRAAEADALCALVGRCSAFLADRVPELQEKLQRVSEAFSGAANSDLQAARDLLADVPDVERTSKAADKARERAARLTGRNPKAAASEPPPAPEQDLGDVMADLEAVQ